MSSKYLLSGRSIAVLERIPTQNFLSAFESRAVATLAPVVTYLDDEMPKLRSLNTRIQIIIFRFRTRLLSSRGRFWFERLVVGEILYSQFFYPLTFFLRKPVFFGAIRFVVAVVAIVLFFFVVAFWFEAFKDGNPIGFVGSYEYSAGDCLLNRRARRTYSSSSVENIRIPCALSDIPGFRMNHLHVVCNFSYKGLIRLEQASALY